LNQKKDELEKTPNVPPKCTTRDEKRNQERKDQEKRDQDQDKKRLGAVELLMFFHNVILCVFSLLTFINTFPIVYQLFKEHGFRGALIGKFEKLYDGHYGYWSHLFYLSKFYEFVDTWIVLSKGKKPLFLQVYHHMGAVLGMWLVTITKSTCGYLFVVENSFIHTMMYFYYAMSVLGFQFKNKHLITTAQIIQFVVGISVGLFQLYYVGDKMRWEDKACLLFNESYVAILLILFYDFYQQSYRRRREMKKQA